MIFLKAAPSSCRLRSPVSATWVCSKVATNRQTMGSVHASKCRNRYIMVVHLQRKLFVFMGKEVTFSLSAALSFSPNLLTSACDT